MEQAIFPQNSAHFNVSFVEAVLHSSIVSCTDRFGNITFVNKNFETVSGYSREELVGKTHKIVNSGFHPNAFWSDMWRTISSGSSWRGEVCNRAKDGSLYWVDTSIYPYLDSSGELEAFYSIRNDITQRKLQKEALTKSGVHMRAILNSTNDIYFLLSPDRKLLNINHAGQKNLTEYWDPRADENYEATLIKAFYGHPQALVDFSHALKGEIVELEIELGEVIEVEREVKRYDGTKVWYYMRYLPVRNDAKESIGVSISLTNIHTRKMQEMEIEAKNQALMKIAWSQSHEMRRPVASILGLMQLRQLQEITNDEFMVHLAAMINELDRFIKRNVQHTYMASQ